MVVVALTVGELVAYAQIDRTDFVRGTKAIAADLKSLQTTTTSSMSGMESSVIRSLADIEQAIGDGFDPADAIADLDRLEASLNQSLDDMVDDADRFAAELERAIDDAFKDTEEPARESGKKTGKGFGDGVKDGAETAVGGTGAAIKRKLAEATRNLPKFKIDADSSDADIKIANLRESLQGLADQRVGIDVSSADALAEVRRVKLELEALDRMTVDPVVKADIRGTLDELGKVESALGVVGDAAETSMGVLGKAGPANVAIVAAAIAALPAVAGLAASAIVAALGGGLLAVGLKTAASADVVQHAWKQTADAIKKDMADVAEPLEGSAIRAADVAEKAFNKLKPSLKRIFEGLVPDVDTFVTMAGQALGKLGPTLEHIGDSFGDLLSELGARMPAIIGNIDDALQTFADTMDDDPAMLANLLEDATELLSVGAKVLSWADEIKVALSLPLGPAGSEAGSNYFFTAMFGGTPEEITAEMDKLPGKLGDIQTALSTGADAIAGMGGEADGAASDVRNLNRALEEMFDPAAAALDAEIRLKDAIKEAADASKKHKMSEVDRLKSVQDLTGAIADAAKAENDRTGKTKESSEAFLNNLGHLTEWAGKNDAAKATISALGDSLGVTTAKTKGGIIAVDGFGNAVKVLPNGKVVKIDADSAEAKKALGETKKKIDDVKGKTVKVDADTKGAQSEVGKVTGKLNALKGDGKKAGQDLGSGLVAGIRSMIADAAGAARSLAQSALQAAKDALGIHSPSTEMAEVGKWTAKGLIQGLEAENGNVKSAVDKMVDTVKAAFKSQPDVAEGLIDFIRTGNKNLESLALQREALIQRLADAKEMAKKVAGTAEEWANITGLKAEDIAGAGDLANELSSKAHAINDFANNIAALAKRGLNKKIIQDIIDAGVEKGATWAEMLVGSDGSEIKALNKAQAAVDKASKKLGKSSADAMYDTGKKAGEGYLTGLQDSLKKLDKEMKKIVDALVRAIKKELKIKSPSQVMADLGTLTMEGYIVGIDSMASAVQGAVQGSMAQAVAGAQAILGNASVASSGSLGTFAASIGKQGATASLGMDSVANKTAPGQAVPAGGVTVNVDMTGSTIRESADVPKIGSTIGFHLMANGAV